MSRKRRGTTWAIGLSLCLHVLALTGMVVGLRVLSPPPEGRAVELRLVRLPEVAPRLATTRRAARRPDAAEAPPRLRPAPQPTPEAPVAMSPVTPAAGATADTGAKGLRPGFMGRLGCDDPEAFHLTPDQRQACLDGLARLAQTAKPLALNIADGKKVDFDRNVHCRDYFRNDPMVPHAQQIVPKTGKPPEAGFVPNFKECPMGDRLW